MPIGQNGLALLTRAITIKRVTELALLVQIHKQQDKWIPKSAIHKDQRDIEFEVDKTYHVRIRKWALS